MRLWRLILLAVAAGFWAVSCDDQRASPTLDSESLSDSSGMDVAELLDTGVWEDEDGAVVQDAMMDFAAADSNDNVDACVPGHSEPCDLECDSNGSRTCTPSGWTTCVPPTESCDGTDQDCDGLVDETFGCAKGTRRPCINGCGPTGVQVCGIDCHWGACTAMHVRCDDECMRDPAACAERVLDCEFDTNGDGAIDPGAMGLGPWFVLGAADIAGRWIPALSVVDSVEGGLRGYNIRDPRREPEGGVMHVSPQGDHIIMARVFSPWFGSAGFSVGYGGYLFLGVTATLNEDGELDPDGGRMGFGAFVFGPDGATVITPNDADPTVDREKSLDLRGAFFRCGPEMQQICLTNGFSRTEPANSTFTRFDVRAGSYSTVSLEGHPESWEMIAPRPPTVNWVNSSVVRAHVENKVAVFSAGLTGQDNRQLEAGFIQNGTYSTTKSRFAEGPLEIAGQPLRVGDQYFVLFRAYSGLEPTVCFLNGRATPCDHERLYFARFSRELRLMSISQLQMCPAFGTSLGFVSGTLVLACPGERVRQDPPVDSYVYWAFDGAEFQRIHRRLTRTSESTSSNLARAEREVPVVDAEGRMGHGGASPPAQSLAASVQCRIGGDRLGDL